MANDTKIVITAETAKAEAAFRTLNGAIDGVSKKMFDLQSFAGTLGGALTVTAFAGMIKSSLDLQDNLNKLAQKTGTSVEALAGLKFAADQNGTSLESVANAAKKLSVNMAENPDVFKKFGIDAKDSTGALVQLADIFQAMPDGVEKTALAVKLMGKNGEEMIPFLNQGGAALKEMVEQGKKLYPITAENAKAAEKFNDQLSLIKAQSSTIGIAITNELLPSLNKLATEFLAARNNGLSFVESLREIGLRSPSNSIRENIKNIDSEIAAIEKWLLVNNRATDSVKESQRADIERKKKAREYYLELERNAALEGSKSTADYRLEGGNTAPIVSSETGKKLYSALKPKTDAVGKTENTGVQVLLGLEKDYQNELAKRVDALNAPLLSASERKLSDDMRSVSKRAQDSRVELEKLNISGTLSLENYHARMQDVTRDEIAQRAAIAELAAEQDKLNASFEYGAQVALRGYLDEVANMANQSETLMKNAFKGMEDALVSFVKTGKLDFSSLADSIISDLIRIQIRASITGPLAGILASFGSKTYSGGADGYTLPSGESTMSANGNVFSGRGISAYSNQIVTKPTNFFANGGNVMGEAGPEAIMPLKRDSSGRLGVRASGGSSLVYSPTVNIDSRTDRAEVQRLVDSSIQQGHAVLVDKLQRQGVL